PISDKYLEYAQQVHQTLRSNGIRASVDDRNEKIGKKIREAELSRVPYMLVVGEKEMTEGKLAVRRQGKGDIGVLQVDEFVSLVRQEIGNRKDSDG
ncbi:MAG TPA: threonine--tRNA ligase, partial [Chitinophagaceae bacterium]|nr:threonine--tRNA ligase [Chitinophagaceae bacterium]